MTAADKQDDKPKSYEHEADDTGHCKKCRQHRSVWAMNVCPVIGEEEVARFRDYEER